MDVADFADTVDFADAKVVLDLAPDLIEADDIADLADFTEVADFSADFVEAFNEVFDWTTEALDLADFTDADDFADLAEVKDVTDLTNDFTESPDLADFTDWTDWTGFGTISGEPVFGETVSGISSAPCWSSTISGTSGDSGSASGNWFADDREIADLTDFTVADVEDFTDVLDALLTDAFTEVEDFTDSSIFADVVEDFFDAATEVFDVSETGAFASESETTDFAEVDDWTDFFSDANDVCDSDFSDSSTATSEGSTGDSIVTVWPSSSRSMVVSRNLNDRTELELDSCGVGGWANTEIDGLCVEYRAVSSSSKS